jgi:hypothetical protein
MSAKVINNLGAPQPGSLCVEGQMPLTFAPAAGRVLHGAARERICGQRHQMARHLLGPGDTAGDQPALPLPLQAELVAYIMAICHAAGAVSCDTDDVAGPNPPSLSTNPTPVVPVPIVTSFHGPRHWTGKNIPADMFFRLNSSQLLPDADSILGPLAARTVAYPLQVSTKGLASPETGSPSYNEARSLARTRSIRTRLITLGVSRDQIVQVELDGTVGQTAAACFCAAISTRPSARSCGASSSSSVQFPATPPDGPTLGEPYDHLPTEA